MIKIILLPNEHHRHQQIGNTGLNDKGRQLLLLKQIFKSFIECNIVIYNLETGVYSHKIS